MYSGTSKSFRRKENSDDVTINSLIGKINVSEDGDELAHIWQPGKHKFKYLYNIYFVLCSYPLPFKYNQNCIQVHLNHLDIKKTVIL